MIKYTKILKGGFEVQRVSHMSGNLILCLFMVFSLQVFGQSRNVTNVIMKPSGSTENGSQNTRIEEEKGIEFFIVGLKEADIWTVEDLLANQKGIDRARISGALSFCTVITLKGSNIGKEFITTLLRSKGYEIEKYSERWIKKAYRKKGEQVYLQDSPPPTNDKEEIKK